MKSKLASFFKIEHGEARITVLTLAFSFCAGFSVIFLYSSSRALFLTYFDARDLAYVYIGVALALMAVGFIFHRIGLLLSHQKLIPFTLIFLILSILGFRLWLWAGGMQWASLFLAIWFDICFLLINLSFWGLCGRLFHIRQAKRLYGLVGSGEFLAIVIAGFTSPLLVLLMGTVNLLFLSCIGLASALYLTVLINRHIDYGLPSLEQKLEKKATIGPKQVLGDRYLSIIHLLWALSVAGLFLADAAISNQAEVRYTNPDDLAGFFGLFYAVTALIVLFLRGLISGRIIDRLGIVNAFYLLPVAVFIISAGLALTSFCKWAGPTVFWLAVGLRFIDYVFRYSFHKPAFMVLYQPLVLHRRLATQTSVESLAEPSAILIVGALLLFGRNYFSIDAGNISYILIIVLTVWLVLIYAVRGEYAKVLMEAMVKHIFRSGETSFRDKLSLSIVAKRLESPNPVEVIFCVNLLEKHAPETLEPILKRLLFHPSELVTLDSLRRIEQLRPSNALEDVRKLLDSSKDPEVMAAALKTYAALGEAGVFDKVLAYLENKDQRIMLGAMVGLIRYGGIEGVLSAGEKLLRMQRSEDEQDRINAARALKEIGKYEFYRPLLDLLEDDAIAVRRAAMVAAEKIRNPHLVLHLISNLLHHEARGQASKSLAAIGEPAIAELSRAFIKPGQRKRVLTGIIRAMERIPGEKATEFLVTNIFYPDVTIRLHVLTALQSRGYQAVGEVKNDIKTQIMAEANSAAWFFNALTIVERENMAGFTKTLQDEVNGISNRILALLSFLYQASSIIEAQKNLKHPKKERRAYAMETIDNIITTDLKKVLFPLLEELSPRIRLERLRQIFPQERLDADRLLMAILVRENDMISSWTKTVAIYNIGLRRTPDSIELITRTITGGDSILKETGAWAMGLINENGVKHI